MNQPEQLNTTVAHNTRSNDFAQETLGLCATEVINALSSQPICPKCEQLCFRDTGWKEYRIARCANCGWHGKTITYDEYITNKLYR